VFARVIADQLRRKFGQPVIVENRAGASGLVGLAAVARAPADGYTLALVSSSFTTAVAVQAKLPFDPVRDLQPVAKINSSPLVILTAPRVGAKSLEEFIAIARKHPKQLNYGTSGIGSMNQFAAELFASAAGIQLAHVPYRGVAPALSDLASGQIDMVITSLPSAQAFLDGHRVVALATTGDERMRGLPAVPTCRQSGLVDFTLTGWSGVLAPGRTPPATVALLNAAINEAMSSPEGQKVLAGDGSTFHALTAAAFASQVHKDLTRWRDIARAKSIQAE
jgi:tripartite-type tricarboxylate transporter receptor subunit TctC